MKARGEVGTRRKEPNPTLPTIVKLDYNFAPLEISNNIFVLLIGLVIS